MRFYKLSQYSNSINSIIAYHGSQIRDINKLKGVMPSYQGGLGSGIYLGMDKEIAEFYGSYVYRCKLHFGWNKVFVIDPDNTYFLEGFEGYSIAIGENIPPFYFILSDKRYYVTDIEGPIFIDTLTKKIMMANYLKKIIDNREPLWGKSITIQLDDFVENYNNFPDDYDYFEIENIDSKYYPEINLYLKETKEYGDLIIEIGLDEIAELVQKHGYSAVYVHGIRVGTSAQEEILVFNDDDVTILERLK